MEETVLHTFDEVKEKYSSYIKNENDRALIEKAYLFVKEKHAGQFRKSGEPYIHHLIEVSYILTTLEAGPATIAAGFLHDVVEDCEVTLDTIEEMFGKDVAFLVDSVTKIQRLKLSKKYSEDFEAEDHKKIFIGMAKDIRVIIIKLADRLHNMRTLGSLSYDRQMALSKETLNVFAPIAHRLGMYSLKSELEDLAISYLEPLKVKEIKELVNQRIRNRESSMLVLKKKIADILYEKHIPFSEIESRLKSTYSIYKKMYVKNHTFDEIYDILALRIITETELNCYEILGLIHAQYKPLPGRFKDYIAMPKPNMYQSLHTTIVTGDGLIFEIQIRTKEMDEVAESGIAAHWRYKEGKDYSPEKEQHEIEEKLHWFRDFVSRSEELSDNAKEYMDSLSHDIFDANVYVFTPKGKVIDLPNGSTPLDFAYRIHTGVGDSAIGAVVNGTLVPLGTVLKTGDVVEIRTSKTSSGPNEGWLKMVATTSAKNHIRKFLMNKNADLLREDKISKGKQALIDAFKERGCTEKEMLEYVNNNKVLNNFNANSLEELFIGISNRNPNASQIISFLNIRHKKSFSLYKKNESKDDSKVPVLVPNAGKVAVNLGSCCTPIPGDEIVGYITKGKGITVHRLGCPNINNETKRLVPVYWNSNLESGVYPVDISIECTDRPNLIVDIMAIFAQKKVNVTSIDAKLHPQGTTTVRATILVANANVLNDITNVLLNVHAVYDVSRLFH